MGIQVVSSFTHTPGLPESLIIWVITCLVENRKQIRSCTAIKWTLGELRRDYKCESEASLHYILSLCLEM